MTRTATARKRFGQHFLAPEWVAKVVAAINPQQDDTLIEVGPGHGALTAVLAARARAVVAFEIDRDLVQELRTTMPANVTIVEGDFLDTADRLATDDPRRALRVAANLPYNVASPILFKLVALYTLGAPLVDATVMLQREVADRLIAVPGGKEYGVLSVLMQHSADVRFLLALPPGAFRPPPQVRSAVVHLRFHPRNPPVLAPERFAAVVQAVFTRRRKTLANALLAYPGLLPATSGRGAAWALGRAGIDGTRRPETLSVGEFARLTDALTA